MLCNKTYSSRSDDPWNNCLSHPLSKDTLISFLDSGLFQGVALRVRASFYVVMSSSTRTFGSTTISLGLQSYLLRSIDPTRAPTPSPTFQTKVRLVRPNGSRPGTSASSREVSVFRRSTYRHARTFRSISKAGRPMD